MPLADHTLLAVHVTDRLAKAGAVQEILSEFGCSIRTRLGLHDAGEGRCSPRGVILLELTGEKGPMRELEARLKAVAGLEVKRIVFRHP